jgi:hypothetical protein
MLSTLALVLALSPALAASPTTPRQVGVGDDAQSVAGSNQAAFTIQQATLAQPSLREPGNPGGDHPRRGFLSPPEELENVVRKAYERLAKLTAAAGEGVEITLSDFQTLRADQLGEVLWTELATLPAGDVIDVVPESHRDAVAGLTTVRYRASWRWHDEDWMATDGGRQMIGMSVSDVLREVAKDDPVYAGVAAVTGYQVRVRLDERERTYRAAVLWVPGERPGQATFFALDHILQGVEEAAREKRPTPAEAPLRLDRVTAQSSWGTCYSWTDTRTRPRTATGTNGHFGSGMHYSGADFSITCRCDAACNSTCDAYVYNPICADTGGFTGDACHKMSSAIDASSDWRGDGTTSGAACAAGLACAQKACLFCACSLGVSVSAFGANVTFGTSGGPDWTGHLQFTATCAPCEQSCSTELEPVDDPWGEPSSGGCDDGGGGGGGGDGGDWDGGGDDGGGSGGTSCADVYCEGTYAGQACGSTAEEMIDEAIDMCGGF